MALERLQRAAASGRLFHGTAAPALEELRPRHQTDWRGRPVEAVFATSDPVWALFFAILRRHVARSLWNYCLELPGGWTLYVFSIDADPAEALTTGGVYVLPRDTFVRARGPYPEWTSTVPVRPLDRVEVAPDDFPYRDRIFRHRPGERAARFLLRLPVHPPVLGRTRSA